MVDDFKGPDGVDYSPIDLYAQYSVTPEQIRKWCNKQLYQSGSFWFLQVLLIQLLDPLFLCKNNSLFLLHLAQASLPL